MITIKAGTTVHNQSMYNSEKVLIMSLHLVTDCFCQLIRWLANYLRPDQQEHVGTKQAPSLFHLLPALLAGLLLRGFSLVST